MAERKDGGPAFPGAMPEFIDHPAHGVVPAASVGLGVEPGMTLRDYFAIHCDQPGAQELLAEADVPIPDGHTWHATFADWWASLHNEERFKWYARVRYRLADAMIREREK